MTRVLLMLAALTLSGCVGAAIYGESRKVTRAGIAAPLASMMPDTDTAAATTCVMKGLTQGEILGLPNSGTLDDPARAEAFVTGAMARPGVGACIEALPKAAG